MNEEMIKALLDKLESLEKKSEETDKKLSEVCSFNKELLSRKAKTPEEEEQEKEKQIKEKDLKERGDNLFYGK